jgi:RNA polymerase sigma-70 factor (sigma-E family)
MGEAEDGQMVSVIAEAKEAAIRLRRATALDELYVRLHPGMVGLAYLITGDRSVAEDLAQEAFVRLAGRFRHLRHREAFAAYLRRTVVNLGISYLRHVRVERRYVAGQPREEPFAGPAELEVRDELWRALGRLTARQRAAVVLRYYEDLSEQQAAEALGVSVAAVRSQLFRAMEALRRDLGREEER